MLGPRSVEVNTHGVESNPGEASRGDGEVSVKSHAKRVKVPVDSIPKPHAWLPDGH
jgi:hypothetical protein